MHVHIKISDSKIKEIINTDTSSKMIKIEKKLSLKIEKLLKMTNY